MELIDMSLLNNIYVHYVNQNRITLINLLIRTGVFIVGAKRTPFCGYGGPFRDMPASHIFASAAKAAIISANVDPNGIDNTVVGNVNFLSQCDGGKTARYCGLYSGVPIHKPALGVSKACGTGLQAIITSALDILTGSAKLSLTGGTENMSSLPLLARNIRFGTSLGASYKLEDYITEQYLDSNLGLTLQQMAEEVAKSCGVSRDEADEFALQSHLKWKAGYENKVFDDEVVSVKARMKKKEVLVVKDELPRTFITDDHLSSLPPVTGLSIVTEGNSSSPADGAAALLLASSEAVKEQNLQPLAIVAGWACVGTDPKDALGAVSAVRKLLEVTEMAVDDVDLFEINETFATATLATARALHIEGRVNRHGGALAVGHAPAATGARMAVHLAHLISQNKTKRSIAASSCGGGQGVAIMFEHI
ncbi:3-ketoacyl-CoA thiolase, mitochondrial-like isoform X1 [Cydia amplana]|uniref:3-ketoacyl-CoA thiolase, mitochondrial-like isoform X1 n=1 Tax=Cydia amplana TaxID=1869771 RepID=UPI002FE6558E